MLPETQTSEAARLQTLAVRLMFCDTTYELYRRDPGSAAAAFGLEASALAYLPAADMPQLRAERRGRKLGVLGEIRKTFGQAYPLIEALPEYAFENFLCDDAFFDPTSGLPHPYGTGPGYENASKFFFWARTHLTLSGAPGRVNAGLAMKGDFSAYLIDQHKRGSHEYYRRFSQGVFWREFPHRLLPIILMTAERHVFRIDDAARGDQVRRSGAFDLDGLTPEAPEPFEAGNDLFDGR